MAHLIVIPTQREADAFIERWEATGMERRTWVSGRLQVQEFLEGRVVVGTGGVGKAQFGIQTQHLIDHLPTVAAVLCVGTSGALARDLAPGNIVVATETVEHDVKKHRREPPRFPSDPTLPTRGSC